MLWDRPPYGDGIRPSGDELACDKIVDAVVVDAQHEDVLLGFLAVLLLADARRIEVMHGWGMTELSPLGAISTAKPDEAALPNDAVVARKARQGRALFPVEAKIVGADGKPCAHDDATPGLLKVRGPAVVRRYYGAETDAIDADGWFDTGDIAVIDGHGFIKLVDRAKGVLQESLALSEPDAFRWIQKTAMDLRLSMREVAEGVVTHGIDLET